MNTDRKGVTSLVINSDTLAAASLTGRNLWQEVKECRYQVVTLAPESLQTEKFKELIKNELFCSRWRVLTVDEAHLSDQWGSEFRPLYKEIKTIHSLVPNLTLVALSASVEPGAQTRHICENLGFDKGRFRFDKRDTRCMNVDMIFRYVMHTYTSSVFRDLDWLILATMVKATDIPKRLVYCPTIELGHRVTSYLRSLLPASLQPQAQILIRHLHSVCCPECKKEGLESLFRMEPDHDTSIFVTTAILDIGVDPPDVRETIEFPTGTSAAASKQRMGQNMRNVEGRGKAYVYVKKAVVETAQEYAQQDIPDPRMLPLRSKEPAEGDVEMSGAPEQCGPSRSDTESQNAGEDMMDIDEEDGKKRDQSQRLRVTTKSKGDSRTQVPSTSSTSTFKGLDKSFLLLVAAHIRGTCISRQMNIIYGDPGISENCGTCSSNPSN
ncbi:hypothetical protein OF83DRAFT_1179521 [Amylostereum chailletii]|nr:hypothetical protein OF83DRAFT_1179521 [Amylostereum chailletii]